MSAAHRMVPEQRDTTFFISKRSAEVAALVAIGKGIARTFRVTRGTVHWDDGTFDLGFKVHLYASNGAHIGHL